MRTWLHLTSSTQWNAQLKTLVNKMWNESRRSRRSRTVSSFFCHASELRSFARRPSAPRNATPQGTVQKLDYLIRLYQTHSSGGQIWRIVGVTSFQECRFLSKLSLGSFTLDHTSVVPARGGAEVALRLYYKTFFIYRTYVGCAQPRPMPECFRRICCTVVVKVRTRTRTSCNATPSDTLRSEGHT